MSNAPCPHAATSAHEKITPLTAAEKNLIAHFDESPDWPRERVLKVLKSGLQTAVEVELATIPIYLYTYYSIVRVPGDENKAKPTPEQLFANKAGATIMSVAVEEMLHMSLSSNVLYSMGQQPEIYLKSPAHYPTNLPGHAELNPDGHGKVALPLAKFSLEQLWQFLDIEYPEKVDAPPEGANWETIGQIYSYIRCLISCNKLTDGDFRHGAAENQIQSAYYAPNNIDTTYAKGGYDKNQAPAGKKSAAKQAKFTNREDSHADSPHGKRGTLFTVGSKLDAIIAIDTICDQGEGFSHTKFDDPSKHEESHYYKFLTLQSEMAGYEQQSDRRPKLPPSPPPAKTQFTSKQLANAHVVVNYPDNPTTMKYPAEFTDLSNFTTGVYQYMLLMTETIYKVKGFEQKRFFAQGMHMSMIWILDKLCQAMRGLSYTQGGVEYTLAPTFENTPILGTRSEAFGNLKSLANSVNDANQLSVMGWLIPLVKNLPDVSPHWQPTHAPYKGTIPAFPSAPIAAETQHACMGLNSCKGQDRFGSNGHQLPDSDPVEYVVNDCAGQGYCSTTADHTCHVQNDCRSQGGCGLYGTIEEQRNPGANECKAFGSCATPINAERFRTVGPDAGKSVWLRAREVFHEKAWPKLRQQNPALPAKLPAAGAGHEEFKNGPTIEWIQFSAGMTACGSSGMSGAGSCA